jgi:hypothetical protein
VTGSTTKKCRNCKSVVDPLHKGKCPACGQESGYDVAVVVNEIINFSDSVVVSTGLYFELTEPVFVPGTFTNSHDMELKFNSENNHLLESFTIKTNGTEEEEIKALHKASRFTNFLTFKIGIFVYHKRGRKVVDGKITDEKIGGVSTVITSLNDLDLMNSQLDNLISQKSKENLQISHFSNGQKALNDNNYSEAIREFFLVIENSDTTEEITYRPLRHAVSHEKLTGADTIRDLNSNFGLSWQIGDSLDPTDPRVEDFLRKEARNLREIAWRHINNSINV